MQSQSGFYVYYYNPYRELCQSQNGIYFKFGNFEQNKGVVFMDFATNFKRICQEKGTSPTRVVLELGLSSNKVNRWNNGAMPKADIIIKLARKLDCDIFDFFEGEEDITSLRPPMSKVEFALDEDEKDIIRLFRMLDRKQKHEFMTKAYEFEENMLKG